MADIDAGTILVWNLTEEEDVGEPLSEGYPIFDPNTCVPSPVATDERPSPEDESEELNEGGVDVLDDEATGWEKSIERVEEEPAREAGKRDEVVESVTLDADDFRVESEMEDG